MLLTGCNTKEEHFDSKPISVERSSGEIGDFNLLTPQNNFASDGGFTFTWEKASNADYYQLEIANTEGFINDPKDPEIVYVKENNLSDNQFVFDYSLPADAEVKYYWKVTAVNKDHKKECNEVRFFYRVTDVEEIPINIDDAQDWSVHKEGAAAQVSIDRNNFFGNDKNSLVITFNKEDTINKGWVVITKSEDRELYGTDSFYFNFFYSGHDATVLIRVLDFDGEYWHKQIQIANNSKQTVLVRYDEFELRTATGSPIFDRVFGWEHIRYFEIVFERTFGDGVCVFSDIKAVKYSNYQHLFMKHMDFRGDQSAWTYENYDFNKVVSDDGSEITINYQAKSTDNPNGFNGYGFQNVNLYKFLSRGDALRMKVKYTGSSANSMFYFRVLEEDMDRWQFKIPFTYFVKNEYKELIIPLKALQRTDYMQGDGAKQLYFVQKFNFGLADNYSTGSLSIKDLEVISYGEIVMDDSDPESIVYLNRTRVVPSNGCIENFNDYDIYTKIYYYWDQSFENKDEAMKLDTIHKVGKPGNVNCGEFDYKADMEQAVYQLYMDTSAVTDKHALSIWLNDASVRPNDPMITYIPEDDVACELTIQLTMDSGEWYRHVIKQVNKEWTQYIIAFDDFELVNKDSLFDDPNPLDSSKIIHMAFGMKYFYYEQGKNGKPDTDKPHPTYAIANPVYIDEIYLTDDTASATKELGGYLKPDKDNENQITIDNFEPSIYEEGVNLFDYWSYGNQYDYSLIEFATDVSPQGGTKSLKMQYKGNVSVSYVRNSPFHKTVTGKGMAIDVKGDGKATIYFNLNMRIGTTVYKMRYALRNIPTTWTHYEIGFDFFKEVNGSFKSIDQNSARAIEDISFGIVNNDLANKSSVYIDNLRMLRNIDYWTYSQTDIPTE